MLLSARSTDCLLVAESQLSRSRHHTLAHRLPLKLKPSARLNLRPVADGGALFRLDGGLLSFVLPKESNQRKLAPAASPGCAGCSALLGRNGGLRNSPLRGSDSPRPFSRRALRCSTTQRARTNQSQLLRPAVEQDGLGFHLWSAEQRRPVGGSRRALFEGRRPELRSRPAGRVAQGSRRSRPRSRGSPFLWWLSFDDAKESHPPSGRNPA